MIKTDEDRFGTKYAKESGYIVDFEATSTHRFGGSSWRVNTGKIVNFKPLLLLALDFQDPRIALLDFEVRELPLMIDPTAPNSLSYLIDEKSQTIKVIGRHSTHEIDTADYAKPPKLTEQFVGLREMSSADHPVDEDAYWRLCDEFVGGKDFIRILGSPIWMQWVQEESCSCGTIMKYVASAGYGGEGDISGMRFFLGEFASYFFLCNKCGIIRVVSQSV